MAQIANRLGNISDLGTSDSAVQLAPPVGQLCAMADDWTRMEVEAVVADYLEMLLSELGGQPYSKASHNRELQRHLTDRSRGSVEFKHQNISAILQEAGYPSINGYKPRHNYQELLRDVVLDRVSSMPALDQAASQAVDAPVMDLPAIKDLLSIIVAPPQRESASGQVQDASGSRKVRAGRKVDYLERESRNRSLGLAGEEFIMRFEHERLWRAGKKALAERIDHISVTRGDGMGYDILSYEEAGAERLIEVKTTRFGELTPFYVTRNELSVSTEQSNRYHLYRVFDFRRNPKLFMLDGELSKRCDLVPVSYLARPG